MYCGFPKLEKAFPVDQRVEPSEFRARDRVRHRRILQGGIDFPVESTYDPYTVGLYCTRVKLGTSKEFYVQIDTRSDVLWVTCNACSGCPKYSGLNIAFNFLDAAASFTASIVQMKYVIWRFKL